LPASSGIDSYTRMLNGQLNILNNLWYNFGNYSTFDANPTTGIIRYTSGGDDTTCVALITHLTTNNNQLTDPMLGGISRLPNNLLDPRPSSGGPAASGLAGYPNDPFFSVVNYKGAFELGTANMWIYGWTALDEYGYLPAPSAVHELASGLAIGVYPNPANDLVTITWDASKSDEARVAVLDLAGRQVIAQSVRATGRYATLDLSALAAGSYVVRVESGNAIGVQQVSKY
jgi:hypothetical protein